MAASGTVDINAIKESIRSNLASANTTTGSPIDLSTDMANRVQTISKINPEKLMRLGNELPALTVHTTSKDVELKTIASTMTNGRREGRLTFEVTGLVWEPFTTDDDVDPADNELELLMENAEKVLRAFDTLDATVKWHFPKSIRYHSAVFDEEAHFRVGVMEIEAMVLY